MSRDLAYPAARLKVAMDGPVLGEAVPATLAAVTHTSTPLAAMFSAVNENGVRGNASSTPSPPEIAVFAFLLILAAPQ